jgi:DNA-binding cell septation regulator SpoVG
MNVTEAQVIPVKPDGGLVAFASCVLNNQLYIGSLGIHRRLDGTGYRLTYPTKKIGSKQLNYFHPITKEAGAAIEKAVIAKCFELFERSDDYVGYYQATDSDS